ncbi:archaeosine synthase subunit alpha [Candidatus Halobonum tyrrellensis]|uniref:tRNA-archaeosine synthase n=1 Tax=Candidatus Halobonum tyrrellensis G22 TaxID=1324957 RepID=V4HDJ4_9EURY|nr:archaeosine synthase subunit alpha [Candidatus Halobonum tyrrellensis]ESP88785.1 tRNA-archaeosine synthase [Candidatus Halobonum tyrrellensis G22]
MTDYFEVHDRDGAARVGELRLSTPVATPALVGGTSGADPSGGDAGGGDASGDSGRPLERVPVRDAGSLWSADREVPEGDDSTLTVLPHRAFPSGTREEVVDSFATAFPDVDGPSAAVVSSDAPDAAGAADAPVDAYALSDAQGFVGHASAFVDAVVGVREAVPADTALYLAGVATPANVSTLVYAGVDLVDDKRVRVKGSQGKYLATDGEYFLEDLDELPCACPACAVPRAEFDRAACEEHNVNALTAELRRVRRRVRDGRLRDYIEGQARHDQWLTATFRELDQQYGYLEQRTPVVRGADLSAASSDTIRRVEIQRFAERVTTRYRNRFRNPLVLVPCSARKPYSESQSHAQFHDAIQYRGHLASMTSPIGVVPQELELTYPAQHYDTVVTGRWSEDEKRFVADVLERYLERNDYPRVIAHVPDEGYRDICERVASRVEVPFEYTVSEHPTTTESIGNLMATLDGELKYTKRERQHNTVRAIADYMLGDGAGDDLFGDIATTSRYPKLQVRDPDGTDADGSGGEQLATMVPTYGVLAFTLAGARRWVESDAPTKRVEIDGFVPQGSVLAPGVVDADAGVRVGDEVVVEGPRAFAVGRAEMSGPEMADSTRGIAVAVRHVEET